MAAGSVVQNPNSSSVEGLMNACEEENLGNENAIAIVAEEIISLAEEPKIEKIVMELENFFKRYKFKDHGLQTMDKQADHRYRKHDEPKIDRFFQALIKCKLTTPTAISRNRFNSDIMFSVKRRMFPDNRRGGFKPSRG